MFLKQDELAVEQYASRKAMGEAAAKEVAAKIAGLQREKESVNIIFAAAPSQNEFLEALIAAPGIDWRRVNGFHMDEYIGLQPMHRRDSAISCVGGCLAVCRSGRFSILDRTGG